ncbi:MAG: hypothetical protein JNG88_04820 [Phycisphaerales bacterium]|nr:hypothetical protein [Phycisphaerales bacterium]
MQPLIHRYREAYAAAGNTRQFAAFVAQYWALRAWTFIINRFPISWNLVTARMMGRIWWAASKRHRERALDNLRPSLGGDYSEAELADIARRSFEHFAQVYLVELVETTRLINEWTWAKHVTLGDLGPALRELLRERGAIMVTPHFGNYELLGYTIAKLGIPLTAIMRPLDNTLITEYVVDTRERGGLSLVFKKGAAAAADDCVARGGTVCFIADQDAGRKGVFADFFGRPASWYKSIALLAIHRQVPIIAGYAARERLGFHYRFRVARIIRPEEWESQRDPIAWITREYAQAFEDSIRAFPEQYLWVHRRWKTRPKEE